MKKEEDQGQCSSQTIHNTIQSFQDQLLLHHHHHQQNGDNYNIFGGTGFMIPQVVSPILQPPPWSIPPVHPINQTGPIDPYSSFFNPRLSSPHLQFPYDGPMVQPGSALFGNQAELGKMTAQEIMEAKALAASRSHSEAERRRRERINNHLAKLRSLLPNTTKTDKASLLAEVIQHVKELKRQTSLIAETSQVPTESDELTVDAADEDGKFVIKASMCCEDRSDLLPDLIKTLKALRLRTLKAEITTLGGRVKNVLFITGEGEDSSNNGEQNSISSIQEALKAVMEKGGGGDHESASGNVKRQRTNTNFLEQRSL